MIIRRSRKDGSRNVSRWCVVRPALIVAPSRSCAVTGHSSATIPAEEDPGKGVTVLALRAAHRAAHRFVVRLLGLQFELNGSSLDG